MKSFLEQNVSLESLITLFSQAPVAMCLLTGDDLIIENANPQILELWGRDSSVIGKPLFEALPEVKSQGFVVMSTEKVKYSKAISFLFFWRKQGF